MGLFVLGVFCNLAGVIYAQIGGRTYQRVKAGTSPETSETAKPANTAKHAKKVEAETTGGQLTIGEEQELTFPLGLKECRVYDTKSLEKALLKATWKGECEWIILRPPSDWNPDEPLWLQMDKPMVLQDSHPAARGHPIIITNDTGRAIIFKTPKNGGCTVIMRKPDIAIMGFTFEGAICR